MPKLSLRHVVGICFLAYAAAFAARPDVGAVRYVAAAFQLDASAITLLFALFGAILMLLPVSPPIVAFLSLPLLIFAVAGLIHAAGDPGTSWVAFVGYAAPFALVLYDVWELVKRGDSGNS